MKPIDAGSFHRCRGFTLLELLVALAIFGLVAVMAYGGLGTVLEQRAHTDASAQRLAALQKTYVVMQRDIEQAVARAIRDEYGDEQAPLAAAPVFQLTRGGWSNPAGRPRSSLQRVGYDLEEQQLVRYAWPVLDRSQDSQPLQQALADHIVSMQVRYLDVASNWQDSWPSLETGVEEAAVEPGLPAAVEVSLEHEYLGNLTWLFQMPR
ncbi:MAG: type II secretion system minor pseudopilin GspJ [Gammaproteobacteria bacterium]|nr:type II secretion system minor pseudopilin GspJ [Gammaproteobacteria bacterium]